MRTFIVVGIAVALLALPLAARADTKLEVYGNVDVSLDGVNLDVPHNVKNQSLGGTCTTNSSAANCAPSQTPLGNNGPNLVTNTEYAQLSSNLSYLGFRVTHDLDNGMKVIAQIETGVDVTATPNVKDSLGSRDSFVGLMGGFGAIKAGKGDSPYKRATGSFDPFSATIGDYNAVMGNTGGDNRAEFDLRLPHAAWYDSPNMGGFTFQIMAAPGQNTASDTSDFPNGEGLCSGSSPGGSGTGADAFSPDHPGVFGPGQGGTFNGACVDGSFGDAYSAAFNFKTGGLLLTAAYEVHEAVNRHTDDLIDSSGGVRAVNDVHDETAGKAGISFDAGTTKVAVIYENMNRPGAPSIINERTRDGYYAALTQKLGDTYEAMLADAHANKTPGDPSLGKSVDNSANMVAVGLRHAVDKSFSWYAVYAQDANSKGGHYGLGQSGHGIAILARTASDNGPNPVKNNGVPVSFGNTPQAVSIGVKYTFSGAFPIGG